VGAEPAVGGGGVGAWLKHEYMHRASSSSASLAVGIVVAAVLLINDIFWTYRVSAFRKDRRWQPRGFFGQPLEWNWELLGSVELHRGREVGLSDLSGLDYRVGRGIHGRPLYGMANDVTGMQMLKPKGDAERVDRRSRAGAGAFGSPYGVQRLALSNRRRAGSRHVGARADARGWPRGCSSVHDGELAILPNYAKCAVETPGALAGV